jgi:hypothetical protein
MKYFAATYNVEFPTIEIRCAELKSIEYFDVVK